MTGKTFSLNVFYVKKKKIYPAYVSKHNSNSEKQIVSWSILRWRKMTLSCTKKLPVLLRGITSKHHSDFYYLNCLHSFATKNRLESHKNLCKNKGFCNVIMPS